jgi:hypothetical protein
VFSFDFAVAVLGMAMGQGRKFSVDIEPVVREANPDHPMEDPERVLVRWHDDGTQGWPYRKYLRIAVPEDLAAPSEKHEAVPSERERP